MSKKNSVDYAVTVAVVRAVAILAVACAALVLCEAFGAYDVPLTAASLYQVGLGWLAMVIFGAYLFLQIVELEADIMKVSRLRRLDKEGLLDG